MNTFFTKLWGATIALWSTVTFVCPEIKVRLRRFQCWNILYAFMTSCLVKVNHMVNCSWLFKTVYSMLFLEIVLACRRLKKHMVWENASCSALFLLYYRYRKLRNWSVTGWRPHAWTHSGSNLGPWPTRSSYRCPCVLLLGWTRWPLGPLPTQCVFWSWSAITYCGGLGTEKLKGCRRSAGLLVFV